MTAAVTVVQLDLPTLRALAAGDLASAVGASGLPLTGWLAGPEVVALWRRRADQVATDGREAAWTTGVVVSSDGEVVGGAGFHEAPDADGRVEIGYRIDPAYRRQGYAAATVRFLLDRARREPDVHVVVASISPDNLVSRRIVTSAGFVHVGEAMDEEDGLEWVYELEV